ncbi:MAG: multidrug effflux MFS transporter [Burkholderiaceae bacterium]|nr:multidrug effflux MFS transporter [Burkholderiaceae bacterium]MCD8565133.1 multidrug effflux MFS transporter [Burkholderiaceae bacterium]
MQTTQISPKSTTVVLVILGMLSALPPLATDMYLPGFDLLADSLNVQASQIQATLSAFFLGLSVGQAIYGPLIDRYGRRIPLLVGISLYAFSTLACLITTDITWFIVWRFLQAIGGCAGMVIGRAMVNDLFDERESARALSLLMMVMTLAPIIAPLLGAVILSYAGWHMLFVVMLAFGLLCMALTFYQLPETLKDKTLDAAKAHHWWTVAFGNYLKLCQQSAFLLPTLIGGFAQGSMFAFITGSPFVFMRIYGVDEQTYGWLFGLVALGLILAAQMNRICLKRWGTQTLLFASLLFNLAATLVLLMLTQSQSIAVLLVPLWLAIASLGFIGANATAIAMRASQSQAGSGSALIGVLQFGCAFIASGLVALTENGTAWPMTIVMMICSTAAFLSLICHRKFQGS